MNGNKWVPSNIVLHLQLHFHSHPFPPAAQFQELSDIFKFCDYQVEDLVRGRRQLPGQDKTRLLDTPS